MSSLVSLRSYQRRRKSAGARLESTGLSRDSAVLLAQQGKQVTNSAAPFPREKRVKSARETRKEQEASDVFPEVEVAGVDPDWGKTKYSEDFCAKSITSPVHIRPVSPTRMNNPHPSKEFLQWKHPVRIHQHKKATNPPSDIWRYLNERFYEDYLDKYNTGDAKNEVPITNLAKIKFPDDKEKSEHRSIKGVYGKKAHLNSRHPAPSSGTGNFSNPQRVLRPPSPQSLMINHTIKKNTLPLFKEWLKSATEKERSVLLGMLEAAHDDSEEMRLSRVVDEVLQSDSAEKVQDWLKSTDPTERQIVLHVLETLAIATSDVPALIHPALYPRLQHRHTRNFTFPLSLQGGGHYPHSGKHRHHHHHNHHHTQHTHHSHPSSSSTRHKHASSTASADSRSAESSAAQMGLVGKKITKPQRVYDEHPEIWQNRILRKKVGTSKVHPAGVFGQPHRDIGQHFSIHPEWPTA